MSENDFEDVQLEDITINKEKIKFDFDNCKSYMYTVLFYICGLLLGSFAYKKFSTDAIDSILSAKKIEFSQLAINDFCLYFSLFLITVFLGYCLIGFPIINAVPVCIGFIIGIKLCYYYVNFGAKGIVYSVIMIIPATSLLLTVIALSTKISTELSKSIYNVSVKKGDIGEIDFKKCLKKYLIYGVLIAVAAILDAGITTIFSSVVTI